MSEGPGKYDEACTLARVMTGASLAVLIVVGGRHGGGFSVQSIREVPPENLARLLEMTAEALRKDASDAPT